jgi:hypothetical protein
VFRGKLIDKIDVNKCLGIIPVFDSVNGTILTSVCLHILLISSASS